MLKRRRIKREGIEDPHKAAAIACGRQRAHWRALRLADRTDRQVDELNRAPVVRSAHRAVDLDALRFRQLVKLLNLLIRTRPAGRAMVLFGGRCTRVVPVQVVKTPGEAAF